MGWNLDKKRPLCPQICEQICVLIAKGELKPGERLMSVRDVAVSASVNPNTVQKSFEQLEQRGVIYSKRGSGWYVSETETTAEGVRGELIRSKTAAYIRDMMALGLSKEDIQKYVKEFNHE
ncbi:MAG: GntR family transcriptional regulator [Parasporobacterium sp.]|nr:GntR family transcriptional regulator [Parasporobacterium sp.]